MKGSKTTNEYGILAAALDNVDGDYDELTPAQQLVFDLHMARKEVDEDEFIKFLNKMHNGKKQGGKISGMLSTMGSYLKKANWNPDKLTNTSERMMYDLLKNHKAANGANYRDMTEKAFIDKIKKMNEVRADENLWTGLKKHKTLEEKELIDELRGIIVKVVSKVNYSDDDDSKRSAEKDKNLETMLLGALTNVDKKNPTTVDGILWGNTTAYKNAAKDEKGSFTKSNYGTNDYYMVTTTSHSTVKALRRAQVEIGVIRAALLQANISQHMNWNNKEKKKYLKGLLETVVGRA